MIELMIVSAIMIMIAGIVYNFYLNFVRISVRGTDNALLLSEAQTTLEVIARDVRSAKQLITLKPDRLSFQRFFNDTSGKGRDPVQDLDSLVMKTVDYRLDKDEKGYYYLERREDNRPWQELTTQFRSKTLKPEIFRGWILKEGKFARFDSLRDEAESVPLIEIRFEVEQDKHPLYLFKKVFLPVPYGELPVMSSPVFAKDENQ